MTFEVPSRYLSAFIKMADACRHIDTTAEHVAAMLNSPNVDVVIALWRDPDAPRGIGVWVAMKPGPIDLRNARTARRSARHWGAFVRRVASHETQLKPFLPSTKRYLAFALLLLPALSKSILRSRNERRT
jgi:hypothetical protein